MPSLREVQAGEPGVWPALGRGGLRVLSWGWALATRARRALFAAGLRKTRRLSVPVLCVGNIAAGGTGKTPFVIWLVRRLRDAGRTPGVLARGYGARAAGRDGLNDEGAVLAEALGADLPQGQGGDRFRVGSRLLADNPQVDVLVLDDGFQHLALGRDLDIVLLDATRPFGFGHLLPRGLLRERPQALRRAGAVVITRAERVDAAALAALEERVRALTAAPIAVARTRPARDGAEEGLRGARVLACSGIGNPEAFEGTLADLGAEVVARRVLPDHGVLPAGGWPDLLAEASAAGAECIAITRKDAVKYERLPSGVTVVDVEMEIERGAEDLLVAIRAALR
jgi:tetraacyldisaccharide 4'-kinase